jgi:hypothetical protein
MPLVQCQDCALQDTPEGCSGFDDCPELKKYDQAMTELKTILPELMNYPQDDYFTTDYIGCLFCDCDDLQSKELIHKSDCLGKRLLEIL